MTSERRLPIGSELTDVGRATFRVWAPVARELEVLFDDGRAEPLASEGDGYFSATCAAGSGQRYRFRIDSDRTFADPASRFQPDGPFGSSEIIDPSTFEWSDAEWKGRPLEGQVIYEMHVGTFTPEGTWAAAANDLPRLADLGITVIEMMPVADFPGRFGWGYDGVNLFAPTRLYGRPDDLRAFVDRAHSLGISVILDVVYNHLGPAGNSLREFAPHYFTDRYDNEWGDAINFDGDNSAPVREFFIANAGYWIDEFHFDGLRLDATQQIFDASADHIVACIGRRVREAARGRQTILVAENETQDVRLVRQSDEDGFELDAVWNDDYHHSAMVALTGHREAYYRDTTGTPQELISAAKYGFLFQGQWYAWQKKARGTPAWRIDPARFVIFLQNHDQVANSARGLRGHQLTSPGRWRAMTALTLLLPATPMLFQGQDFSASAPFLFFADFSDELAEAVRKGRGEFLEQFTSVKDFRSNSPLDNPADAPTFERCKLDAAERDSNHAAIALHHDLLALRRHDAFARQAPGAVDGSVIEQNAFLLRFFAEDHNDDRLLLVNLGCDVDRDSIADPLIAPPAGRDWRVIWSSEDARYGGSGTPDMRVAGGWHIPGESAVVLAPDSDGPPIASDIRAGTE